MSDRALSDVVGYVLIFALVLLTATTAVTLGTSALTDVRDAERAANVEAAFDILAENVEDHATERATGRATEIKVADGKLHYGEREEINIYVNGSVDDNATISIRNDPIAYESDGGERVVYSTGALFRENDDGSYMFREPNFRIDDDRVMLPLIEVRDESDSAVSVRGSRTALVRTWERSPDAITNSTRSEYNVTIEVDTESVRTDAWETYAESYDPDDVYRDDGCAGICFAFEDREEIYVLVTRVDSEIT